MMSLNEWWRGFRLDRPFLLLIAAIVLTIGLIGYANAQTVDMRPGAMATIDYIASAVGAVLTVLTGFGIRFLNARTGLLNSEMEASLSARLNDIIYRGIDYARLMAENEVQKPGSGLQQVRFDNIFVSWAASYVNNNAPGILKRFQITDARLFDMIAARIPGYAAPSVAVPVTGAVPQTGIVSEVARQVPTQHSKPAVVTPDTGS